MSDAFRLDDKVVVLTGAAGIIGTEVVRLFWKPAHACSPTGPRARNCWSSAWASPRCADDVRGGRFQPRRSPSGLRAPAGRLGCPDVLLNNAAAKSANFFEPFETFALGRMERGDGREPDRRHALCPGIRRGDGRTWWRQHCQHAVDLRHRRPDQRIYEGSEYLGRAINTPAIYAASKAGLWGLTQYLATYWGHVACASNAVTPGGVFSGQNETFVDNYSQSRAPGAHGAG